MTDAHGWNAHRDNLAKWAMQNVVNRTDCCGAYSALTVRGTPGTDGEPIPTSYTDKHGLTLQQLQTHFSSWAAPENVVGVHTISLDDTCKAVSLDVDAHSSEADAEVVERNLRFAMAVHGELDRLGLRGMLWDSNGKGGYHVDVIFSTPIPAAHAFRFGQWLVRNWREFGFVLQPESFPKQPSRNGKYGNWLRLIGRHHTRDFWAKVYDAESGEWLAGEPAALAVLAHQTVSSAAIPAEAIVETKAEVDRRTRPPRDYSGLTGDRMKRAAAYLAKIPPAISQQQGHDQTFKAAIAMARFGLSKEDAFDLMADWNDSCDPPWSDAELWHKINDAYDKNPDPMPDRPRSSESNHVPNGTAESVPIPALKFLTAGELLKAFPSLRSYVIEQLLRSGETMNVISAPKFGKSWLVLGLVLSIATGQKWLGKFWCKRGRVLLIDNELHPETLASRLPRVAESMGLKLADYQDSVCVITLRGQLIDLERLSIQLLTLDAGAFDLIVLDAWYRLQPKGSDENANSDVTQLYNLLDLVASKIGAAFVCVHHSSKGNQSSKAVTDVGSGAGAQARAPDVHMILRAHEADKAVVVDAAIRSSAPLEPFCMRWEFPGWIIAEDLDPKDLRIDRLGSKKKVDPVKDGDAEDGRQQKEQEKRDRVLEAYRMFPNGETATAIRESVGMSGKVFGPINLALIRERIVEACKVAKNQRQFDGFRMVTNRHPDNPDNPDKNAFCPACPTEGGVHTRTSFPPLGEAVRPGGPHQSDANESNGHSDNRVLSDLELDDINAGILLR